MGNDLGVSKSKIKEWQEKYESELTFHIYPLNEFLLQLSSAR